MGGVTELILDVLGSSEGVGARGVGVVVSCGRGLGLRLCGIGLRLRGDGGQSVLRRLVSLDLE